MKNHKFCQSCGMPFREDPAGGGTEADGTKSTVYCSYCYRDGSFTFTGSLKVFQKFCRQKMIEKGLPRFTSWLFTRGMGRLERWKRK